MRRSINKMVGILNAGRFFYFDYLLKISKI